MPALLRNSFNQSSVWINCKLQVLDGGFRKKIEAILIFLVNFMTLSKHHRMDDRRIVILDPGSDRTKCE